MKPSKIVRWVPSQVLLEKVCFWFNSNQIFSEKKDNKNATCIEDSRYFGNYFQEKVSRNKTKITFLGARLDRYDYCKMTDEVHESLGGLSSGSGIFMLNF